MNDFISRSAALPQRPAAAPPLNLRAGLVRAAYRLGGLVAPGLAGRMAADAFARSRPTRNRSPVGVPSGAQTFAIADNDDVRHGYLWKGPGPTVLLVHGWGADSSSMTGFVEPLLALGFQVAALDAPAHGASPGNKTTMTRFVKAVGAAMRSLDDVQIIVAHALGAMAAVAAIAYASPDRARAIRRLVLIAAPASLSTVLERWVGSRDRRLPPAVIDRIYERLFVQNGVPVGHWDIGVLGAALNVPVLVVHDEHDPVVPLSEARRLMRSLHNVRLEQTSGLGHSGMLSAAQVRELVTRFIAEDRHDQAGAWH